MQKLSLHAVAREQLNRAKNSSAARSAETVFGGHEHALRQTVISLVSDAWLNEHENPGEATVEVLFGRIEVTCGNDHWSGRDGDLIIIPDARHALHAVDDSAVLLTTVPRSRIQQ